MPPPSPRTRAAWSRPAARSATFFCGARSPLTSLTGSAVETKGAVVDAVDAVEGAVDGEGAGDGEDGEIARWVARLEPIVCIKD